MVFTTIHREINYVSGVYNFPSILCVVYGTVHIMLCPLINVLSFYISTVPSKCAVPNMTVFCSSLTSWFPGMLLLLLLFTAIELSLGGRSPCT